MIETRQTLLRRLKDPSDQNSWEQFYQLYAPLLLRYSRGLGLSFVDAVEVRDACLALLVQRLKSFEYDPQLGSFRAFLFRMVRGQVIDLRRRDRVQSMDEETWRALEDEQPGPRERWERVWIHEHLLYCLETIAVSPLEARTFRMLLLDGATVAEVGRALGLNPNQIYKTKSKVLKRIRNKLLHLGIDSVDLRGY
jgi:RNA polymerase sigma-70 factor (ECF subfamily)